MNTDDYYQQQIQRLTADRDYWQKSEHAAVHKIAELESQIRRLEEEKKIADTWMRCVPVKVWNMEMYADMDESDGTLLGLYSKPGQNVEEMLDIADMDMVCMQLEEAFEEMNRD